MVVDELFEAEKVEVFSLRVENERYSFAHNQEWYEWDHDVVFFFAWRYSCVGIVVLNARDSKIGSDYYSSIRFHANEVSFLYRERIYQFISSNEHSTNDPCFRRSNVRIFFSFSFLFFLISNAVAAVSLSLPLSPVQRIINTAFEWRMIDSYTNLNLIIERCIDAKLIVLTGRQKNRKWEDTPFEKRWRRWKRKLRFSFTSPLNTLFLSLSD